MKLSIECGTSAQEMQEVERLSNELEDLKGAMRILCKDVKDMKEKKPARIVTLKPNK